MARANLNKSEKSLDFLYYYHSIKVHTQEALNLQQLKSPFSDPNLFRKSASILIIMIYPLDSRNTKKLSNFGKGFCENTSAYKSPFLKISPHGEVAFPTSSWVILRSLLNKLACLTVLNTVKRASLFVRDLRVLLINDT